MIIKKAASVPIIVHDPYFSIWSSSDRLYDTDTVHWSRNRQKIRGYLKIDGDVFSFMGDKEFHKEIPQKSINVTATATTYVFENDRVEFTVKFTSPLLLEDFNLVSRPCTYIDYEIKKKVICEVEAELIVSSDLVTSDHSQHIIGDSHTYTKGMGYKYAFMGRGFQKPLGSSGDNVTIDWGYAYLATQMGDVYYDYKNKQIGCKVAIDAKASLVIAYDDVLSINYFGQWRKAYWTNTYASILEAIAASFKDKDDVVLRAEKLDEEIELKAREVGGDDYVFLCNFSYRHSIAAHKLITDEEGNVLFLSKENDSNGCIGTVDVSYPSVPLYLLYNTEYVKGMLRPVFKFAESDVWEYDFAPHDVGRYPYAWGQVYGLNPQKWEKSFTGAQGSVFPPFYMYPKASDIFDIRYQMPVEECGNMLILTAVVCERDNTADFALQYLSILKKWTNYLLEFGEDPGEQLCTDDFAGHLSHNVNLSAKAIMGIEAYARILDMIGECEEATIFHQKAKDMAKSWQERAYAGNHYSLSFGNKDTWSLKYNLIWDKYFESQLFDDEVYEKELAYYIGKNNEYGVPLDSRETYTKSDWILWCASFAKDKETAGKLISPIANYLENTETRVPFSDWYDTKTSKFVAFIARSVQGGIFMPILVNDKKCRN